VSDAWVRAVSGPAAPRRSCDCGNVYPAWKDSSKGPGDYCRSCGGFVAPDAARRRYLTYIADEAARTVATLGRESGVDVAAVQEQLRIVREKVESA
jgi:hypothetical protein